MAKKMIMNEYCELAGRLKSAVSRDVKLGRSLKGVIKMEKIGRTHIFHVDMKVFESDSK